MIFRIPKGKHRARPLRPRLYWRRPSFAWTVRFDESCRYDLQNDDQYDINKLVGVGYLPGHHTDSARFGWRYLKGRKCIDLQAYCYISGARMTQHICYLEIGRKYRLQLNVTKLAYVFDVYDVEADKSVGGCAMPHYHGKSLQYRLGPWFGGNNTAPHNISILIDKA
jgi:hypothetical protein